GAGAGNRARDECAGSARLLAENCCPLAKARDSWKDQGLLHSRCALCLTKLDANKSTTVERNQFSSGTRNAGANIGCRRIQARFIHAGVQAARRLTTPCRFQRSPAKLADGVAQIIQLVVPRRSLF